LKKLVSCFIASNSGEGKKLRGMTGKRVFGQGVILID
jgi:hypothetical protein